MTPGQMLWRHRRGATLDELAELEGISRYQVHRIIMNERWRSGEVVITEKALRQLLSDHYTVRQIAEHFFCSVGCVEKRIKRYKIKMPKRGKKKCEQY